MQEAEHELFEEYSLKITQLQEYLSTNAITRSEYDELVNDFSDVEAIRDSIKDEKLKIHAENLVSALTKVLALV
tara:strand:- start:28770 stop:28991 length:222 start_codon:yes stop_codon:yes gene_type:complete